MGFVHDRASSGLLNNRVKRGFFFRGSRTNAERVNIATQQIRYRCVDKAVALKRSFAAKGGGDNMDAKMTAGARTGVASVGCAVIPDLQPFGQERGAQPLLQERYPIIIHSGNTLRNG